MCAMVFEGEWERALFIDGDFYGRKIGHAFFIALYLHPLYSLSLLRGIYSVVSLILFNCLYLIS